MAWGNFITLPCPYKKWDNKLKNLMLALLPSVGAVVSVLFVLLMWGMQKISFPPMLMTLAAEFYLFYIHGFMHLDGFMDCTDAIMSRRPLEDRQRIMKDPTVGSFAVVMTAFLLLAWFASFYTAVTIDPDSVYMMALIPVVSRGFAGNQVLKYKPIGHSQYVEDYKDPARLKCRIASDVQMVVYLAVYIAALVFAFGPGNVNFWMAVIPILAAEAGAELAGFNGRRQLGGMSGDIAGYAIVWSELAGVTATAIAAAYLS